MAKAGLSCDIAIVGGGMVGLSLALILSAESRARGCRLAITILESGAAQAARTVSPGFNSRATALSLTSIELLEALGLWSALAPSATSIRHVHVSDRGHSGRVNIRADDNQSRVLGAVIDNATLGRAIEKHIACYDDITLRYEVSVSDLSLNEHGAYVSWTDAAEQRSVQAALVVLADGADSPLRSKLGLQTRWHDYEQDALLANVEYEQPHKGVAYERFTPQGPLALLPLGGSDQGRRSALIWTHPKGQVNERLALADTAFLDQLQRVFGYRLGCFTRVGERKAYPLRLGLAVEQVRSSLVLMGNAAHSLHPIAGQGFNLALRDAAHLAAKLLSAAQAGQKIGSLSVLQAYLDAQRQDQSLTTWISHNTNRLFASPSPILQLGRNLGLLATECCPTFKASLLSQMIGRGSARAPLALYTMACSRRTCEQQL